MRIYVTIGNIPLFLENLETLFQVIHIEASKLHLCNKMKKTKQINTTMPEQFYNPIEKKRLKRQNQ